MQLRTEIEISAPPDRVWEKLIDFPSYADWNPYFRQVEGKLAVGEQLRVVVTPGDGSEKTLKPRVLVVDPGKTLRWKRQLWWRGVFDGEHFWELTPVDGGRTKLVHGEDFSGWLVQHMGPTLTHTARGCVGMNLALKKRVESP